MNVVPCSKCGLEFTKQGMASHQRGDRCKVFTARNRRAAEGLTAVHIRHEGLLRAAKVPYERDLSKYIEGVYEGAQRQSPRTEVGLYVKSDLAKAIKRISFWSTVIEPPRVQLGLAGAKRESIGFVERIKMVAALSKDDGLRSAWIALDALMCSAHLPLITASQGGLTDTEEAKKAQVLKESSEAIRDLFRCWESEQ